MICVLLLHPRETWGVLRKLKKSPWIPRTRADNTYSSPSSHLRQNGRGLLRRKGSGLHDCLWQGVGLDRGGMCRKKTALETALEIGRSKDRLVSKSIVYTAEYWTNKFAFTCSVGQYYWRSTKESVTQLATVDSRNMRGISCQPFQADSINPNVLSVILKPAPQLKRYT